MITNFKIFENNTTDDSIKVGDWILMTTWWAGQHLHKFIETTPAEITHVGYDGDKCHCTAEFSEKYMIDADPLNPGVEFRDRFHGGKSFSFKNGDTSEWISHKGEDKEEIDMVIDASKFNL